jgi:MerR family copper efflux transcriptional regulator
MQISELAKSAGVSVHALRHYERVGLIHPPRSPSGYRDYPESMRREVIFIAMSREIGFSLKAIAEVLPSYRAGRLTWSALTDVMQTRITDIDQQMISLKTQRKKAVDHIAWIEQQRTQVFLKTQPQKEKT